MPSKIHPIFVYNNKVNFSLRFSGTPSVHALHGFKDNVDKYFLTYFVS